MRLSSAVATSTATSASTASHRSSTQSDADGTSAASTPPPTTEASESASDGWPLVTIHVQDEGRRLKRDFYCYCDILAREMRYFAVYLADEPE